MRTASQLIEKTLSLLGLIGFLSLLCNATWVLAEPSGFDRQMEIVLVEYLKIPKALAADKQDGVVDAAKRIEKLAKQLDPSMATKEHLKHYKDIPAKLKTACKKMIRTKSIDAMREVLKELSKPMAMWATMSKPMGISVVYCSMAPGSWLQHGTTIANPYYGAKMLRCGEIVAGEGAGR